MGDNIEQSNTYELTAGERHNIGGEDYIVQGYAELENGEIRTIYVREASVDGDVHSHYYYQDSAGVMEPAFDLVLGEWKCKIEGKYATYYKLNDDGVNNEFYYASATPDILVPGATDQKNLSESLKVDKNVANEIINRLEILIKNCKNEEKIAKNYAKEMNDSVRNIRGNDNVDIERISTLINILEKIKKDLEDSIGIVEEFSKDKDNVNNSTTSTSNTENSKDTTYIPGGIPVPTEATWYGKSTSNTGKSKDTTYIPGGIPVPTEATWYGKSTSNTENSKDTEENTSTNITPGNSSVNSNVQAALEAAERRKDLVKDLDYSKYKKTSEESGGDEGNSSSTGDRGYYPRGGTSSTDDEEIKVEIVDSEKPTDSGSFATPNGSSKKPIKDPTNPFEKPTEAPTEIPTEKPTILPPSGRDRTHPDPYKIEPDTKPVPPTEKPTTIPPIERPTVPVSKPSTGGNTTGGGWYRGSSNTNPPTQAPTEAPKVAEDVITRGNTYKLPTSTKISPTTAPQSKGNSVIPVLAGLGAAAAAGIGAKAYIDKKNNSDNEENEEFKAEDWSNNTDVNIEYNEPTSQQEETLDFDDDGYGLEEPEKYGARTHEELEDLQ